MNPSFVPSPILTSPPSNNGTQIASSYVQPTSSVNTNNQTVKAEPSELLTPSQAIVVEAEQQLETKKKEELYHAVKELNEYVKSMGRGLSFRLDEESGRQVITVFEVSSGEIIRQIPDEKMLEVARELAASASGLIAEKI
ncbi:flagellar protein FlaG [Aliivibrio sp. S4TY2]|uniref:flagellar protein FlaG n=1 Tax=unclassified Aliivibrio TaxID=2645654 RepID=UPI002378501C|nr:MULTISPECIES: flagellar protein FlaG [unclassified Aliivibrio]MDD9154787.1 flagellar protein FlaG [Aliivibrio sp. S4TY2]MDD9158850.1 flagellar protein FlaG [Aliivibrio sp. S4TY1]MDD9162790.1 flagellar protein FlaG [Aliivibrio sp. S4MY2]MDD9166849.1 flagellar protein FlaG [Aliivibrio sp. S4MY4]MDD9183867.1 flagellar protein FlaG [Aliivibrio sp. S4MY3]